MPFGLKNVRATYQMLVDTAFQSQIEINREAYVDDMVIKSNDEKILIEDIAETLENLRRIDANPKKTKEIADMQSPRTLKEMQSLSGKLAALNRFLSRSAKRSLPFFETLKDITKENKDEYRWTESAEKAFQEMKKIIVDLPLLTTRVKEETLYVYVAVATEAVLADFLSEAPVGTPTEEFFRLPAKLPNKDDMEIWTLFTDGASNSKGSGAGLVLISPSGAEYTYTLRLNFTKTNNEAEYEALLAGLCMERKMKVQDIDVKVDSKLVATEFKTFDIQNIPRNLKQKADILSKLATHAFDHLTKKVLIEVLAKQSTDQKEIWETVKEEEEEEDNWMTHIIRCLAEGVWPKDRDKRRALRMKINEYVFEEGVIFKNGYLVPMLRCVGPLQANYVIREIHMRSCRMHIRASTRSGVEAPQNTNDFNHGPMAILSMGNGHPWAPTPSFRIVEVCHSKQRRNTFKPHIESEAVILAEIGMSTHRIMMIREDENEDELCLNMDLLQERREASAIREAKYKTKIEQYYNQKVKLMSFKPDEYVFRKNKASRVEDQGKLGLKWEGPYKVTEAYQNGSYKLQTMGGKEVPQTCSQSIKMTNLLEDIQCVGKDNGVNILKSIDEGPFQMRTFQETLDEGHEGALHLGLERPRVYSDLSPEEKEMYNADI
uniref:Reverse transcriptase domain-containing protein n=1 Tax=Tanacetum cinerariifolium TaxID=118510 RepID=A0A6L2KU58_TANCI|nr:reverse transcriptase domain-containing protein [Tanacetum cinerariifolium]